MSEDERIRQAFDKLRADDTRRAPSFEQVRDRPAPRPRRIAWLRIASTVTAAAAGLLFVMFGVTARKEAAPHSAAIFPAASVASVPAGSVASEAEPLPSDTLDRAPEGLDAGPNDASPDRGAARLDASPARLPRNDR
jgi:hypothetical protein